MEDIYNEVYDVLKQQKNLPMNNDRPNVSGIRKIVSYGNDIKYGYNRRLGFPCQSTTFGFTRKRFDKKDKGLTEYVSNKKYPLVYQALLELASYIIPDDLEVNSITLNHNLKCKPHIDAYNKYDSIIVGLGDYTGGELCLYNEDKMDECIDIKNKPLRFNGSKIIHSTNDFEGDRWSVVYFCK